jgi:hypothetical protein
MTKEEAVRFVLRVLNSRMAMMSPDKKKAQALAEEHGITALDLIQEYDKYLQKI